MRLSDQPVAARRRLQVLLADDHPVVLAGMKALITADGDIDVVAEAIDGLSAVELAAQMHPEIAVIDISMPGLSGKALAIRMKEVCPNCKILTLTVHEDHGYLKQMLEAGVSGYLLKRSAAGNLITALRIVDAGGIYIDPTYSTKVWTGGEIEVLADETEKVSQLSGREIEVLKFLAAGHSVKATAASLQIGVKTAETYKSRAFEKLGLRSRVELIRLALNKGWLKQ